MYINDCITHTCCENMTFMERTVGPQASFLSSSSPLGFPLSLELFQRSLGPP